MTASFLYLRILFWKNYRFTELYIHISSNIKRSHVPFATFFPVVTSCKYPTTSRILKLIQSKSRTLPSPQGPSCCPFRVTQTFFTEWPEPQPPSRRLFLQLCHFQNNINTKLMSMYSLWLAFSLGVIFSRVIEAVKCIKFVPFYY